jgi:hypothetical protein
VFSVAQLICPSLLSIGAPGYDPFGPQSANFNQLIGTAARDPVSGTASHRSYLCEIRPAGQENAPAAIYSEEQIS